MARKNQSIFEMIFDLAKTLPWWLSIILALISFIGISIYENHLHSEIQHTSAFSQGMISSILPLIKWLVFSMFTLGAVASLFNQVKCKKLFSNTATGKDQNSLNQMSWQEFEQLSHEIFRQRGYWVTETPSGADGGVDLVLEKNGLKTFVQCKQWKVQKVGVKVIRELYGVMALKDVKSGIVITSGEYTAEAKDFAAKSNIVLINGGTLFKMIVSLKETKQVTGKEIPEVINPSLSPACPQCGSEMVKRMAKQGKFAGNKFWGCTTYPKCRGTMPIN